MAEFALIAPMGFLLIMSIVVLGIVITNFIQVTNVARAGARMAAICAGEASSPGTIPDGSSPALQCTVGGIETFMENHLTSIPAGSVTPTIQVCSAGGSCTGGALSSSTALPGTTCNTGSLIEIQMSYPQPLYLPMVSAFFQTSGNGTRLLQASAEVGCE